jgi:hypothetical protein
MHARPFGPPLQLDASLTPALLLASGAEGYRAQAVSFLVEVFQASSASGVSEAASVPVFDLLPASST